MKKMVLAALLLSGCASADQKEADAVKATVAAKMKDPDSAKFSGLKFRLATLCGEVNSKNSFGAYAGAERFHGVEGAISLRSEAQRLDAMLEGTDAGKTSEPAVARFDRSYDECQAEGKPVT
jgi:hypothetical protein